MKTLKILRGAKNRNYRKVLSNLNEFMKYTFLRYPKFLLKAVTLSYDDGVIFDEKLIEIMSKNGLKGTFNLNSKLLAESDGSWVMTQERALKLYNESGNEIALHGARHISLTEVDSAVAVLEVLEDRRFFEEKLQKTVCGMAYAFGSCNKKTFEILKNCGIRYSRTVEQTECFDLPENWLEWNPTAHHNNPNLTSLTKCFIEKKESPYVWRNRPMLFYVWGHSYEFNNNNDWHVIEKFAESIGNRKDVWYATNGEIYEYVNAYNQLRFGVDEKFVYNPTAIDVYLNFYGKEVLAKAGKITRLDT